MVAATTRASSIVKRFYSGTFAPPSGFTSDVRGPEVSVADILAGGVRESDWSFPVLISTPSEDRQGDCVLAEGCEYSAYAASPICFFDHQEIRFPVGKMRGPDGRLYFLIIPGVGILGRIWIRQPQPDDPPAYAEACKTVWILVRDGLLNGISAGFDPVGPVKELASGGSLYKRWELLEVSVVPVAANRECRVLREPFGPADWDASVLKRFTPSVIKGLRSMTTKGEHHNTHDIKYRDGEWVILDNKTRKPLSHHKTRADAVAAMRALQYGKHGGKSTRPATRKGMGEGDGTSGGYTVPEEHKAIYKAITERMEDHDAKGHSLHFNHETGELHHSYPDSESEDKIKAIAADLHDVPGVKSMTQEPEAGPKGEGFNKVYPEKDMGDGDMTEESHRSKVEKRAQRMARIGKATYRMVKKRKINRWIGKSLERSVRRIMPGLLAAEVKEDKAIQIAWGVAAVHKGLLPLVEKAAEDGDDDEDDQPGAADVDTDADAGADAGTDGGADATAAPDEAEEAADNAATDAALESAGEPGQGPDGLELVQTAIENLEAALPKLEPERREFWAGIIQQIRDHGEETYPDEDFGGSDEAGAEGEEAGAANDADQQEVTDEMLARYKGFRPRRIKRISIARKLKSLQRDPELKDSVRKGANHLHEIGDMPADFKEGGAFLKGYTPAHHRHCRIRARELDRLHGALAKGEMPHEEEKPEEHVSHPDGGLDMNSLMPHLKGLADDMMTTKDYVANSIYQLTGKRSGT